MLTLGVGPSAEMWKRYKPYLKQDELWATTALRRVQDSMSLEDHGNRIPR